MSQFFSIAKNLQFYCEKGLIQLFCTFFFDLIKQELTAGKYFVPIIVLSLILLVNTLKSSDFSKFEKNGIALKFRFS